MLKTSFIGQIANINFNLPKGYQTGSNGMYLVHKFWGQGSIESFGWVDAGVTKSNYERQN